MAENLSRNPGVNFNFDQDDDNQDFSIDEQNPRKNLFDLDFPTSIGIPIQRVSSEDELNFLGKAKRAKFVGSYLFGDAIGQGSYGKVKECLDRRNLCRRAVKIMQRRRLRKTPHGEQMALTEIRLLKSFNHPNIIRLYDFIQNDEKEKFYLFIDLCVASLQELLDANEISIDQKRPFPLWQAHNYFVQLVEGLEYLHSKFIVHNDIKPGNLLLTIDQQLKITDFGTAEQLDYFNKDDTIRRSQGTPAFQCPEIANGEDTYHGFAVDIWSTGVTLYNLVTGRLPFEADNIYLLFQTIGKGIYKIPEGLDTQLTSLIAGILQFEPLSRLKIEQIKQHDWFRRRPVKTLDELSIPKKNLERFEQCTVFEYIAVLHQSANPHEQQETVSMVDTMMVRTSQHIQPISEEPNSNVKSRHRDSVRLCSIC